ncbi:MAG: AbiV family abortive infection protein [Actinomycetota bacterium]|nr:AbiV family abortive infection protein [Candidatus Dormibacteraeota bacterium]MDQ6947033.1 AbiV family abortive infection protein [Actinomycetota bacterium]
MSQPSGLDDKDPALWLRYRRLDRSPLSSYIVSGSIDPPPLAQLARAALDNASDLLDDAEVLLAAQRWPRAYSLAILAAEEFGKFMSCVVAGSYEADDRDKWRQFWRNFRDHSPKMTLWAGHFVDMQDWGPVGSQGDREWAEAWASRQEMVTTALAGKMAGLYVDCQRGEISIPREQLGERTARETVFIVAAVLKPAVIHYAGDLTSLVSPPPEFRQLIARGERAKTPAERAAAAAALQGFLVEKLGPRQSQTTGEDP